ncbi:hypothetical protein L3Q82_001176 [Scortum barcoo]|uniref:Uncharacterized protein n=1 Tax=Scortum barcoo TaxID=214431 RepID=A0ACB8W789_9TELE|nr:hypothetical protein L3Q82_001176 [Scortum barcoo]
MKCFERLVKSFITSSIPDSLDPLQFAYRPNRSTEDAFHRPHLTLHTALSHLDQRDTYVRMLFIDYSSAFNTVVCSKLVTKFRDLGLNSALCDWILNFLTGQTPGCADGQHHILHPDSEHSTHQKSDWTEREEGACGERESHLPAAANKGNMVNMARAIMPEYAQFVSPEQLHCIAYVSQGPDPEHDNEFSTKVKDSLPCSALFWSAGVIVPHKDSALLSAHQSSQRKKSEMKVPLQSGVSLLTLTANFGLAFNFNGRPYTFTRLFQGYCESPTLYNEALRDSLAPLVLSPAQDRLQFAYQPGVGVEDAILYLLHRAHSHLDKGSGTEPSIPSSPLCFGTN